MMKMRVYASSSCEEGNARRGHGVMAAGHSSPSQLADLQAQLFSVANHLSSDS